MNRPSFDPNRRAARWSAILFGVIGVQVFIVQPGFVQGLVDVLGYSERQAGSVAAAEMIGIALTASVMTLLAARLDWRRSLLGCCVLAVLGNVASAALVEPVAFAAARFVAGLGLGGMVSLSWAAVGLTRDPDREFALYLTWVLIYGAAGLFVLPVLFDAVGVHGVLLLMALFTAIGVPFIRYLPPSGDSRGEPNADAIEMARSYKIAALTGVLAYNIAQGAMWAYLGLIGTQAGIQGQEVANALTVSQVFGIAGALTAFVLGSRVGRRVPLVAGILAGALSLLPLMGAFTLGIYAAAVIVFNYMWNMTLPYILASVGSYDRRGLMVVYAVALQMIGLGIGPAIAAAAVGPGSFARVIAASVSFFVLSLALLSVPLMRHAALRARLA